MVVLSGQYLEREGALVKKEKEKVSGKFMKFFWKNSYLVPLVYKNLFISLLNFKKYSEVGG